MKKIAWKKVKTTVANFIRCSINKKSSSYRIVFRKMDCLLKDAEYRWQSHQVGLNGMPCVAIRLQR